MNFESFIIRFCVQFRAVLKGCHLVYSNFYVLETTHNLDYGKLVVKEVETGVRVSSFWGMDLDFFGNRGDTKSE